MPNTMTRIGGLNAPAYNPTNNYTNLVSTSNLPHNNDGFSNFSELSSFTYNQRHNWHRNHNQQVNQTNNFSLQATPRQRSEDYWNNSTSTYTPKSDFSSNNLPPIGSQTGYYYRSPPSPPESDFSSNDLPPLRNQTGYAYRSSTPPPESDFSSNDLPPMGNRTGYAYQISARTVQVNGTPPQTSQQSEAYWNNSTSTYTPESDVSSNDLPRGTRQIMLTKFQPVRFR